MSWNPNTKEIEAVSRLPGPTRYSYFIKKAADHQQIWSLWKQGWATTCDDSGQLALPVWPHEDFAKRCAIGAWADYVPKLIGIEIWFANWLPGLVRDNLLIAVLPSSNGQGVIVDPGRLESDLQQELNKY